MSGTEAPQPCTSRGESSCLTRAQFTDRFQESWKTLWCVGAAVLGSRNEVDDVLQESALIALEKLNDFDPQTSFKAWMSQIVRYTALNTARRRLKRNAIASIHDDIEHPVGKNYGNADAEVIDCATGELTGLKENFDDQLLAALQSLDDVPRACILLRTVADMSYMEISQVLEIPQGTAMSHVHRARKTLRERLSSSRKHESRPSVEEGP